MSRGSEPAYPGTRVDRFGDLVSAHGTTLREHFAGLAMSGLTANPNPEVITWTAERVAKFAVAQADALLAELAKDSTP